ncbi:MAG: tetratricopeptide repeat protein [Saprospiraceae bacterium]|nr:tetratricopeptide repeat protein [Candidatus Parvibacillus calidus]MCC7149249.1 tetratricopeptide repeat protein [Saprospiraceae bacterium]
MFSKVIVQGRLDFGNANTYDKALKLYTQRKDVYYKNEVIFNKMEECFDEENLIFFVKRFNNLVSDKYWRNTVHLLKNLAEYSVTGRVEMWMMVDGKVIRHEQIRPSSDKSIVASFYKANEIVNENGDLSKAMKILDGIISKYEGHSMAHALAGRIAARQGNIAFAIKKFDLATELDPCLTEAYLWKGKMLIREERYKEALPVLEKVTECSIAHQNIHWIGRRLKGKCYFHLGDYEKAIFEWKLFTKRPFEKGNSNHYWKRMVTFSLGKAYLHTNQHAEAILSFNNALELDPLFESVSEEEIMKYKAIAGSGQEESGNSKKSTRKSTGVKATA